MPEAGKIIDCCMTLLTLGITMSPNIASQIPDYKDDYPRAADLIHKTFYVDDCPTRTDSLQEPVANQSRFVEQSQDDIKKVEFQFHGSSSEIPDSLREKEK